MITVKLTSPLKMDGFEPESVLVTFPTNDIQEADYPVYEPNAAFELDWKGYPDKYGLMHLKMISAESFADIAGTQNFIVEIIGGTEK